MIPLQIRFQDETPTAVAASVGFSVETGLEFALIHECEAGLTLYAPGEDFACHSSACRPPTSGGTGGSQDKGGSGRSTFASNSSDLDLLFPGRRSTGHKVEHPDGTFSVEGLNEDGTFRTYKPATEAKLKKQWDDIGPTKDQYVANMVLAGKLAMGIDPETGKVNAVQANKGLTDSKWYSVAHSDVARISKDTGIPEDAVTAATTTLSAGRLWSGTKNGNIETVRALADIVKNPIEIVIEQKHLDMMAFREAKSTKGVGKVGLTGHGLTPGTVNSKDMDAGTLVELMYAINTTRGHSSFDDWKAKTSKDGKPGMKSSKEQISTPGPFPYFTSKGTQQVKQAVAILRGEVTPRQAISGPKYSSFYSNIRNPDKDYSSTNDTWHYRIMAGNLPLKAKSTGEVKDIRDHSIKDFANGGKITSTQDMFQSAGSSKGEGLESGDGMFRDTTRITRAALNELKAAAPDQFGNMKIHEFQALIWVHYGGGQVSDAGRTKAWFGALDTMSSLGL